MEPSRAYYQLVNIRRAVPQDNDSICDLISRWRPDESGFRRKRLRSSHNPEWVAVAGSQAIGWLNGHHQQGSIWQQLAEFADGPQGWNCSYISEIFVAADQRKQGIGSDLLKAFETEAREYGNTLVVLNPDASEPGLEERLRVFYGNSDYYLPEAVTGHQRYLLAKKL